MTILLICMCFVVYPNCWLCAAIATSVICMVHSTLNGRHRSHSHNQQHHQLTPTTSHRYYIDIPYKLLVLDYYLNIKTCNIDLNNTQCSLYALLSLKRITNFLQMVFFVSFHSFAFLWYYCSVHTHTHLHNWHLDAHHNNFLEYARDKCYFS